MKQGRKIRDLRIKRGYTVSELAEKVGISTKYMYKIERGEVNFSANILLRLAESLNVSCDYILKDNHNDRVMMYESIKQFTEKEQLVLERILFELIKLKEIE